jgi:hypothetical protein
MTDQLITQIERQIKVDAILDKASAILIAITGIALALVIAM